MKYPAAKLLLLAAVVGLAAVAVLNRSEDAPIARKAPPPAEAPVPGAAALAPGRAAPTVVSPEADVARSMDETVLRQHVARLRMAAATGDETGKASATRSLLRYGTQASRVLDGEISREPDVAVRYALEEARKALK